MSFVTRLYDQFCNTIWGYTPTVRSVPDYYSHALGRQIHIDVYLPPAYSMYPQRRYPLLLLNDGQDLPAMHFIGILSSLYRKKAICPIIAVGLHANKDRMREYGTTRQADYKGRGDKARQHEAFILTELLPFLFKTLRPSGRVRETAFAGFSLGGLSAFDIAWGNPNIFGMAGVFSGALWWRWAPVQGLSNADSARIMHDIVRSTPDPDMDQRFWFQTGTLDELEDRNQNGIIDAIDDTVDLMNILRKKGYGEASIRYLELEGGRHDVQTWGKAMPDFLGWAFGKKTVKEPVINRKKVIF